MVLNVDSKSSIFQVRVSTETPAKNGVFNVGVASFHEEKLALSQRTRHDDFKLTVSDSSSMKGLSAMQKEAKMKTFLASPSESGRRRARTT